MPVLLLLMMLLLNLLHGESGASQPANGACTAGAHLCGSGTAAAESSEEGLLPQPLQGRLAALGLDTGGKSHRATLDALLDAVLAANASTERSVGIVRRRVTKRADFTVPALETWSKVLQKKKGIEAAVEQAEAKAEFFEFEDDRAIDDNGKEVIMSISGQEMRDKQDLKMGKSPLRDDIVQALDAANDTVNWPQLSALVTGYAAKLAKEKTDLNNKCIEDVVDGSQPLHRALRKHEKDDTLFVVIGACPQACAKRDRHGMLPWELAKQEGASAAVINRILKAYPAADPNFDPAGETPGWWGTPPEWWVDRMQRTTNFVVPIETVRGVEWIPITFKEPFTLNTTTMSLLTRAISMAQPGNGAVEFVELLLQHGADANLVDPSPNITGRRSAPFLEACRVNQLPLAELMLMRFRANPLLGKKLGVGIDAGVALSLVFKHSQTMIAALANVLQAQKRLNQTQRLCSTCPTLLEWRQYSPTLAARLNGQSQNALTWSEMARSVHEWCLPFVRAWLYRCQRGRSNTTLSTHCARALQQELPADVALATAGAPRATLWHALARVGDRWTLDLFLQALNDEGREKAMRHLDSNGNTPAETMAMAGFTVRETMLSALPDLSPDYEGPFELPSAAQRLNHSHGRVGWYRQRWRRQLRQKQRRGWMQEDNSGGWDGRLADLGTWKQNYTGIEAQNRLDIDEVSAELDAHTFFHTYVIPQRPVLVRGATSNWAWLEDWRKTVFLKRYSTQIFNVTHAAAPGGSQTTLVDFVKLTSRSQSKGKKHKKKKKKKKKKKSQARLPLPKKDAPLLHSRESGSRDSRPFLAGLQSIPRFLSWRDEMSKGGSPFYLPPLWMEFSLGPAWSGRPPHINDGHSWNSMAFGSRRWCMWPPGSADGELQLGGGEPEVWLNQTLPAMLSVGSAQHDAWGRRKAGAEADIALQLTQEAGDALYIPHGWASAFVNLQESIGVAEGFMPNLSLERAEAILADPSGKSIDTSFVLIDG